MVSIMDEIYNLVYKLRTSGSLVRDIIRTTDNPVNKWALKDISTIMEKAADTIGKLAVPKPLSKQVKIIRTETGSSFEGAINEFIQNSITKYEDFDIIDIKYHESNTGILRAMILYQYRDSTRS